MLISFSVENWRSFRDRAEFSMVATKERHFSDRLMTIRRRPKVVRLLPTSAIFGGNASGKSNLVKAMEHARAFIVTRGGFIGENVSLYRPFALDKGCASKPSSFSFSILISVDGKERVFDYSFSVSRDAVVDERLVRSDIGGEEHIVFDRNTGKGELFDSSSERDRLDFILKGTRKNGLFLTNAFDQNVAGLSPVIEWFKNRLYIILPETRFIPLHEFEREERLNEFSDLLRQYDTGIQGVRLKEIQAGSMERSLPPGMAVRLDGANGGICVATNTDGSVSCKELKSMHVDSDGDDVPFSFSEESDGTRRLVDIVPMIQKLRAGNGCVFVVDELDRSIHPNLMERMLQDYLGSIDGGYRGQLIFTTHDSNLLDQRTIRRDEAWVVERDLDGASSICAVSDFRLRKDADIRNGYLIGRFGGVPRV